MKKNLFLLGMLSLLLVGGIGTGYAAVSGPCVNCHTMHNSQGGDPMRWDEGTTPLSALLRGDCLGCHTTDGTDPYVAGYPYVMADADTSFTDDKCLAGGFFTPTTVGNQDNNGDTNHTIGSNSLPAGYATDEPGLGDFYTGDTEAVGLSCAGSNGCHGVHNVVDDMAAISGGHHDPSGAYRILYVGNDTAADGVVGAGASDYEEELIVTPSVTAPHNTYSAGVDDPSISELCAICHGNFHNESGTTTDVGSAATTWIRHPTDVVIPDTWEIGDETTYTLTGSDYKNNPVGYDNALDSGQRMATCLSCHRAHGTANADLLRWAYSTQDAGSSTAYGCLGCHDRQR